jgi:hypothetical protein
MALTDTVFQFVFDILPSSAVGSKPEPHQNYTRNWPCVNMMWLRSDELQILWDPDFLTDFGRKFWLDPVLDPNPTPLRMLKGTVLQGFRP